MKNNKIEDIDEMLKEEKSNLGYISKFEQLLDWGKIKVINEYANLYHKNEIEKIKIKNGDKI